MVRRTRDEALETRNTLLDTAERVFGKRGVARTSLDDIARAARMTRGAIYWHFRDKADLFRAMVARVTLPMEDQVCAAWDPSARDPLGHVRDKLVAVLERTATDPQCRRVFHIVYHKCEYVDEMKQVWKRLGEMRAGCLANVERGFRAAVAQGQLPRGVDPRRAAVGIYALVDGLINNWVIDPDYVPLAREAGYMIDLYLEGLRHMPPARAGARRMRKTDGARA
ncbi:MAG: TetR family transcriptional regulator [Betaproteobacteria bacterium]|nr:TetR family transcriptional regulator [Betaproteobacteria bacterium]